MEDTLHIVVATDDNYAIHTQTLVASICENNTRNVSLYILGNKLSQGVTDRFLSLSQKWGHLTVEILDVNEEYILGRFGGSLHRDRSLSTYARVFIPELLPSTVDRAIYLDVDAVVLRPMGELLTIDMDGYAIAGVEDTNPMKRRLNVGLTSADHYINAGFILWNLDYCRRNNVTQQFIAFVRARNGQVDAMDQGTINGTLKGRIKILHPKWDVMTSFQQFNAKGLKMFYGVSTYTDKELREALENPVFVHFTPNFTTRPWQRNCRNKFRDEYWKYRNFIDSGIKLEADSRTLKNKLAAWLFFHLPLRAYILICKK